MINREAADLMPLPHAAVPIEAVQMQHLVVPCAMQGPLQACANNDFIVCMAHGDHLASTPLKWLSVPNPSRRPLLFFASLAWRLGCLDSSESQNASYEYILSNAYAGASVLQL